MFDFTALSLGGVQLIALVFGLTEFLKVNLNWEGKKVTILAALLGVVVLTCYQLIGIVPEPYSQVLTIFFTSIAGGLSAAGYFKFIDKRAPARYDDAERVSGRVDG